jgi:hypothetical protein
MVEFISPDMTCLLGVIQIHALVFEFRMCPKEHIGLSAIVGEFS